jgi:hypothetical protein
MAASGQRRMNRLRDFEGVITPQPPLSIRNSWRNVNTPHELNPEPPTEKPASNRVETYEQRTKK